MFTRASRDELISTLGYDFYVRYVLCDAVQIAFIQSAGDTFNLKREVGELQTEALVLGCPQSTLGGAISKERKLFHFSLPAPGVAEKMRLRRQI